MNSAIVAIIGLAATIAAYVVGYDLWAQATGHQTISGQFHVWILSQLAGPIVVALWVGASTGLIYHFLINR